VTPLTDPSRPEPELPPEKLRDVQALGRFDTFLYTAVGTVLVVRTLLAVTGYPQVGGNGLHVAHVLWGGLLMAVAIVLVEVLPGTRIRLRAAFLGGIGFGLFIDEVGKFLTKDVNYFFHPAIAIIYAVFVGGYVLVRLAMQRRVLSDRRRLAIASATVADLALGELDAFSRSYALRLLDGVDETSELRAAAEGVRSALLADRPSRRPGLEGRLARLRDRLEDAAERLLATPAGARIVTGLFVLQAVGIGLGVFLALTRQNHARAVTTMLDTVLPSTVSTVLLVVGVARLAAGRRLDALRLLRVSVVVQMLFTQVVVFNRQQWLGLAGFAVDLVVLWILSLALQAGVHSSVPASER
jgi:hypothetical protein